MPESNPSQAKHVAALAFPFATHAAPLLSLILRISSFSPTTIFSFFSTKTSNETTFENLDLNSLQNIRIFDVYDGLKPDFVPSGNPLEFLSMFLAAMPGNFETALKLAEEAMGESFSCIISDAFYWFGAKMARDMNALWVPVWTAGPRALLTHIETDAIIEKFSNSELDDNTPLGFIPGFSSIRKKDLPRETFVTNPDNSFPAMVHKMGQTLHKANVVTINSFEELDDPSILKQLESRLQKILNIGPLILASPPPLVDDYSCLSWLDTQPPSSVIYISFGSVIVPPPHELAALAQALEETKFPFIWSFRGNPDEKLPEMFVSRAKEDGYKIVPWTPQLDVLRHKSVGAFLTHCGWNSILESMIGGVPMIARPFFGDQHLNRRTIEAVWGIGIGVEGEVLTRDGIAKAFKRVLVEEEGREMRNRINKYKELAHKAVEDCGSSTKNFQSLVEIVTS